MSINRALERERTRQGSDYMKALEGCKGSMLPSEERTFSPSSEEHGMQANGGG